ncbi:GntR family transcriptional regulator [Phenylobacterium terrae]|uniref:GntR family transcriptional regulator n=1 Tax=Phenylobacterium terrae TaxID=2665495 RepID=A0ABW4N6F9_9CAUL
MAELAPALPSLTDKAAFWLKRDIVRGVFLPNERIKVDPLSKFYGVGRSPIQAGIMQLEPTGLLSHEHQKGHRVAPVSLADYDDVRQLYRDLYRIALRRAVKNGDMAWEERVVLTLHRTSKVPKVIDVRGEGREMWQMAYKRLHAEILSGCGSPLLTALIADLGNRVERYVNLFADLQSDLERDHHKEHRELVDIVLERDAQKVIEAFDAFFQRAQPMRDTVVEKLRSMEETKPARRPRGAARPPPEPAKPAAAKTAAKGRRKVS